MLRVARGRGRNNGPPYLELAKGGRVPSRGPRSGGGSSGPGPSRPAPAPCARPSRRGRGGIERRAPLSPGDGHALQVHAHVLLVLGPTLVPGPGRGGRAPATRPSAGLLALPFPVTTTAPCTCPHPSRGPWPSPGGFRPYPLSIVINDTPPPSPPPPPTACVCGLDDGQVDARP